MILKPVIDPELEDAAKRNCADRSVSGTAVAIGVGVGIGVGEAPIGVGVGMGVIVGVGVGVPGMPGVGVGEIVGVGVGEGPCTTILRGETHAAITASSSQADAMNARRPAWRRKRERIPQVDACLSESVAGAVKRFSLKTRLWLPRICAVSTPM